MWISVHCSPPSLPTRLTWPSWLPFSACLAVSGNSLATLSTLSSWHLSFIIVWLCVKRLVARCGRLPAWCRGGEGMGGRGVFGRVGVASLSLCIAYFDTLTCIKSVGRCPLWVAPTLRPEPRPILLSTLLSLSLSLALLLSLSRCGNCALLR